MEVEIKEEDLSLRVDHFWRKVFGGIDSSGDKFVVLPKMVKCTLALCHSNVDVERSLTVNKRMLTKMNTRMSEETINGLRSTKAAVQKQYRIHTNCILNLSEKNNRGRKPKSKKKNRLKLTRGHWMR